MKALMLVLFSVSVSAFAAPTAFRDLPVVPLEMEYTVTNPQTQKLETVHSQLWENIGRRFWRPKSQKILASMPQNLRNDDDSAGMVHVSGQLNLLDLGAIQDKACLAHESMPIANFKTGKVQAITKCFKFDREAYYKYMDEEKAKLDESNAKLSLKKRQPITQAIDVYMDRFEFPNREGEHPIIMATYYEAQNLCKAEGKRLCTEKEWTFACEGEEGMPYPYGYERDATACNIDKRSGSKEKPDLAAARDSERMLQHLDILWRGEKSGNRPACKSWDGVMDLTGNVDEWTTRSNGGKGEPFGAGFGGGYVSVLKGGYWGHVRNRCRPSTKAHGPDFAFYQIGFRCCRDVK